MGRRLSKRQALDKVSADYFGVTLPLESYFGDILYGIYENKLGIICAAVGVLCSCLFVVYSELKDWPEGRVLDLTVFAIPTAACVAASILLLFLVGFTKIHSHSAYSIVTLIVSASLLVLDCYIFYRVYGAQVVTPATSAEVSRLYVLALGIVGLLLTLLYSLKSLCVHTVNYSSIMAQAFDYVRIRISSRSTYKAREGITYGVSLHPSFQVVSTTSDPHLRVRAALRSGREVKVDHIFIEHKESEKLERQDSNMSAYDIDDMAAREVADNLNMIASKHSAISTFPPVFIILGAVLGVLWVLYIALATYTSREPTMIKNIADDMKETASDLTNQWSAVALALQALNDNIATLTTNSSSSSALTDVIQSLYTLNSTSIAMNEAVVDASNDLNGYSDWMSSLYHSLSLALTVGALIALPVIVTAAIMPLVTSSQMRRQLQKGVWKDPRQNTNIGNATELLQNNWLLLPLYMGSQLGTLAVGFCVQTGAIAIISLLIIFPASRNFFWSWRWHLLGLKILLVLGITLLSLCKALPQSNRRSSLTDLLLSFYLLLSGQWCGVYRFLLYVLHSCVTWSRVDIPMISTYGSWVGVVDVGFNAFISIVYSEHCRRNPIVITAANIFKSSVPRAKKNRRAENRWLLAYTLVKNPSLISYRRRDRHNGDPNIVSVLDRKEYSDNSQPAIPPNGSCTATPRQRNALQLSSISMDSDSKPPSTSAVNGHHGYLESSRRMFSNVDDDEKSIHSYHPPHKSKSRIPRTSLSSVTNQGTTL